MNVVERHKGKSFAEASAAIERKYPKRETNALQQKSFLAEMAQLMVHQEGVRTKHQAAKFPDGGVLPGMNITPARESTYVAPKPVPSDLMFTKQQEMQPGYGEKLLFWLTGNSKELNTQYDAINSGVRQYNTTLAKSGLEGTPKIARIQQAPRMDLGGLMIPQVAYDNIKAAAKQADKFGQSVSTPTSGLTPTSGPNPIGNFLRNNIYAPVALGKGLEFLGKTAMFASGYDRVNPELNPFEGEIRSTMQGRGVNMDSVRSDIASGLNAAIETSGPVRSQAVRQALVQNASSNAMGAMANAGLQQQQMNNQYAADYASVLNNLGQQEVAARNYTEQLNNQSKVGYQTSAQNLLESIGGAGQELTNFRANLAQQQLLADTMRTTNFQMGNARNLLMQAVNGKRISVDDAIQIVQSSTGKTQGQVEQEILAAEQRMNQAVKTN